MSTDSNFNEFLDLTSYEISWQGDDLSKEDFRIISPRKYYFLHRQYDYICPSDSVKLSTGYDHDRH